MNLSCSIGLISLVIPAIAQASVTAVWSPTDSAAAAAWLGGIGASEGRQDPDSFFYFSTDSGQTISAPIIGNLTVWSDRAELNILGIGALPSNLQLWGSFLGIGSILEIPQSQLALANPDGGVSYFSYTASFPVEDGFSRIAFNSAASDGLLLIVDSGTPPSDAYSLQLATIAAKVGLRLQEAGENIAARFGDAFSNTAEVIDTTGLRESMNTVLGTIREAIPKPDEVKNVVAAVAKPAAAPDAMKPNTPESFSPIVTSLGKVGGGGYSSGTLDAQRENNRLTGETNRILTEIRQTVGSRNGTMTSAFG